MKKRKVNTAHYFWLRGARGALFLRFFFTTTMHEGHMVHLESAARSGVLRGLQDVVGCTFLVRDGVASLSDGARRPARARLKEMALLGQEQERQRATSSGPRAAAGEGADESAPAPGRLEVVHLAPL